LFVPRALPSIGRAEENRMARTPRKPTRGSAATSRAADGSAPPPPAARAGAAIAFAVPGSLRATQSSTQRSGGAPPRGEVAPLPMGLTEGRLKASVRVGVDVDTRAAAADPMASGVQVVEAVPGEDVVVLHIENGPPLMLSPENARLLMLAQAGATRAPATPPARARRGAGGARGSGTPDGAAVEPGDVDADAQAWRPNEQDAQRSAVLAAAGGERQLVPVAARLRWSGLEAAGPVARGAQRGLLGEVLVTGFDIVTGLFGGGRAEGRITDWVLQHFDGAVDERVLRLKADALPPPGEGGAAARAAQIDDDAQPALVLVHGTFSNTHGTFHDLWTHSPQTVREIFKAYHDRVYALEHRTLSASPLDNALTLVRACPKRAGNAKVRLHLLTHSRGGLVAEVLVRLSANDDPASDARHFAGPEYAGHRRVLAELRREIAERHIEIGRVVRVACPARGTLLASGRLDAYLSVLRWTMGLAKIPLAPSLIKLLAEVARRRADPTELPGLESMIPGRAFIDWLHDVNEPAPGELRVIAGDIQGDSIASWLKTLLADGYYWSDNDFVVQTSSMYGGVPRAEGATFFLEQSGSISHFEYFAHERTSQAIADALTRLQPSSQFRPIGPLSAAGQDSSGTRAGSLKQARDAVGGADKPAVIVVPGILGSHLKKDGKRVWLGWRLIGGLDKLAYAPDKSHNEQDADGVAPDGVIGAIYDDLVEKLQASHDVIVFSYDWRLPIEQEAVRLAQVVEGELAKRSQSNQPVRIVAHSMGGLVSRVMQLEKPEVWHRMMSQPGARLLMLGTPNGGSWCVMQTLSGDDTFSNLLAAFGAPFQDHKARQQMAEFPGFIQLQYGLTDSKLALDREATWAELAAADLKAVRQHNWWHADERQLEAHRWGVPPQAVLDRARALRERLDRQADGDLRAYRDKLLLVTGIDDFTPDGYELGSAGLEYLDAALDGDGRVTLASAMLEGVATWRAKSTHGNLPDEASAFDAYLDLLQRGDTDKLPSVDANGSLRTVRAAAADGARGRGAAAVPVVVVEPPPPKGSKPARSRPARTRTARAVPPLGESALRLDRLPADAAPEKAELQALQVEVINGDLSYVDSPLLIGHYRSVELTGAEAVVNRLLGGALQRSLDLQVYPDPPGTCEIFINAATGALDNPWRMPRPEAAIVVGLGEEGKLQGRDVALTVRQGALAWAQRMAERHPGRSSFELASTLISSGGQGMHTGQVAQMIVQGLREANERLRQMNTRANGGGGATLPVIAKLKIVELYQSRAIEAWSALRVMQAATPAFLRLGERLGQLHGGLRRPLDSGYRGANYDLVTATTATDRWGHESIQYTLDSKRARSEVRAQSAQIGLLRRLVESASSGVAGDRRIGRTLFQLLVPIEMEPFLGSTSEVLLELDGGTAPIPWEMLEPPPDARGGGDQRPWAVRSKLLRRLRTADFRAQPRDAARDASVLVVGNPQVADERYPPLEGARQEALAVHAALTAAGALRAEQVKLVLDAPALDVVNALFERDWRIVHIAAHGERPEIDDKGNLKNPRGIVLGDQLYLSPSEIRSMRAVPELVFVNCCHLAAMDAGRTLAGETARTADRASFAAGVAEELIKIGVRCVVACGWAVDDDAAERFAKRFYRAILANDRFIDAVAHARAAALGDEHAGSPVADDVTWAAYQCYGDPEWRLEFARRDASGSGAAQRFNEFEEIGAPSALALALETLAIRAQSPGAQYERIQDQIRYLESRHESAWGGIGAVAEAFGLAWSAADDRPRAIAWYERAVHAADGSASFDAEQQWARLRLRQAESQLAGLEAGSDEARNVDPLRTINECILTIDAIALARPSAERAAMRGSARKRLALAHRWLNGGRFGSADERRALEQMMQFYDDAARHAREAGEINWFYPAMNVLAARFLLDVGSRRGAAALSAADQAALREITQSLEVSHREKPEFFAISAWTELDVMRSLREGRLASQIESILRQFDDLHRRVGALRKWESILDQVRMYAPPMAQNKAEQAAVARLLGVLERYANKGAAAERAAPGTAAARPRARRRFAPG
jgi:hypothetical protein